MQGYTYKYGDRPLEGYTIQRAAGRGGFGEVYYALSDSGREVALKAVQGFEAIELRGISQCMNLKSPHLVTIFDVKYNESGKPFVIMEFVAGPSLRDLIDESPAGLGTQKAAFFLREMGKGLTYLHDRGIVHRDLKPGNVFYEDGYVKIGDYGLSKAMSASQHSGQTITVGTVHYMAPEIGEGRYDRSIDIYALGCMLYEMLTGQTPFLGNSPGEILMKHLMAEPDFSSIEEPFAGVIRKAMAKDPKDRYQTVQEMIEAVFGAAHIQQSVSCFSPESLTMVAGRVAKKVGVGGPGSSGPIDIGAGQGGAGAGDLGDRLGRKFEQIGERIGQAGERFGRKIERIGQGIGDRIHGQGGDLPLAAGPLAPAVDANRDPLGIERVFLAVVTAGLISAGTAFFSHSWGGYFPLTWLAVFLAITGGMVGLLMVDRWLEPHLKRESKSVRRLAYGGAACLAGVLASLVAIGLETPGYSYKTINGEVQVPDIIRQVMPGDVVGVETSAAYRVMSPQYLDETALVLAIAIFLTNWWQMVDPARRERISLDPALGAGAMAFGLGWLFDANLPLVTGVLAGLSLAAQACSPFDPLAVRAPKHKKSLAVTLESEPVGARQEPSAGHRQERGEQPPVERQAGRSHTINYQADRPWNGPLGSDGYPVLPPGVSPQKRLWALLMTAGWFVGISGIQRFYAGRIASGLLWLLTWGLFGFGQLIDAILIATGQFRDRRGRRLMVWNRYDEIGYAGGAWNAGRQVPPSGQDRPAAGQPAAPAADPDATQPIAAPLEARPVGWQVDSWSRGPAWTSVTNPLLAALAGLLMIVSLLSGLVGTLSMPVVSILTVFEPSIGRQSWYESLMDGSWQAILDPLQIGLSIALMFLAVVALLAARRWAGGAHMVRAIVGPAGMLMALHVFRLALNFGRIDWPRTASLIQHGYVREGLGDILRQTHTGGMVMAGLLMLASILVLAWPPRRPENLPAVGKGV